jgi:hypothetical protein
MHRISIAERRRRLARRHHLVTPAATVEKVSGSLVGLHSSDPVTVYLSCRARVSGFTQDDLERALYDDKTLLRLLGMRRTLFAVPRDLAPLMDAACTKAFYDSERRRLAGYLEKRRIGPDAESWLKQVEERTIAALEQLGEATANELRALVPELKTKLPFGEGKSWGGEVGISTRMLFLLATQGAIIRGRPLGTWLSSQYRWSKLDAWLGSELEQVAPETARVDLVRRWLSSYGPGTLEDIKWWTGWGVRVTRSALEASGAVEVDLAESPGYALPDDVGSTPSIKPWAAFLPSLDPTVMGWKNRKWYLGDHREALFDRNGNAGPTIWSNGRIVGGWAQGAGGSIRFQLLEDVSKRDESLIIQQAAALESWLGDRRFTPRFRTPLERELIEGSP